MGIAITSKGRWAMDTYKAVLRDGGTRDEASSEMNRLLFPGEWASAVARGEVPVWQPRV